MTVLNRKSLTPEQRRVICSEIERGMNAPNPRAVAVHVTFAGDGQPMLRGYTETLYLPRVEPVGYERCPDGELVEDAP